MDSHEEELENIAAIERLSIESDNEVLDVEGFTDEEDVDFSSTASDRPEETCARVRPYTPRAKCGSNPTSWSDSPIYMSGKRKPGTKRCRMIASSSSSTVSGITPLDSTERFSLPSTSDKHKPKRKRRKNVCPYCEKSFVNFSRHLTLKHADEEDVKAYIQLSEDENSPRKRRKRRTVITNRIRNRGNQRFNQSIVDGLRHAELLPSRHSFRGRKVTNITHVNCKHCFGLFSKRSFFRHAEKCKEKPNVVCTNRNRKKRTALPFDATLVVKQHDNASESLRKEVFPKMQKDAETVVAQSDSLICKYGSNFRFTHRGTKQINYCSSRMRSLAVLLTTMKSFNPDIQELRDCLRPQNFNLLVESVRLMSKFDPECGESKSPSVPGRLCSSLKKCANIVLSETIKNASLNREQKTKIACEMNDFLHLMDKDWATEVGTNSENTRRRMRALKQDLLPEPEDIKTFCEYIKGLCPEYISRLKLVPTVKHYEELAKLVVAHIITLNRRRPNEVVEITLDAYRSTLNQRTDYGGEVEKVISKEKLDSSKEMSIFYVPSNKNMRKVPVLLTKEFHEAVEVLISSRERIGLNSKYLFGRPGKVELFDGGVVLRETAVKANLKNPATFTANALRHHAATSSKFHSEGDTFSKQLSRFMGHDLRTHEYYYEMPLPLVDKTVVGHCLLQMTLPTTSKTSNPCKPSTSTATSITSELEQSQAPMVSFVIPHETGTTPPVSTSLQDILQTTPTGTFPSTAATSTTTTTIHELKQSEQPLTSHIVHVEQATSPITTPTRTTPNTTTVSSPADDNTSLGDTDTPPREVHPKKRWSSIEKNTVYQAFGQQFILRLKPTRQEIQRLWETNENLRSRTLQQVVTYVNNIVNNKHHIPTPKRKKIERMVAKSTDKFSP